MSNGKNNGKFYNYEKSYGKRHIFIVKRDFRQKLGLTQQQVTDSTEINLRQYQKFESSERLLTSSSFRIAYAVIEVLELDISKFNAGYYVWDD